jgi:pilus assembly protein Flp/PilA
MKKLAKSFVSFLREEDGVTAIEYGLIAALIAIVIIAALVLTGQSLNQVFTTIGNCLAAPAAC